MTNKFEAHLGARKAAIVEAVLRLADRVGVTGITTKRIAQEVGFVEAALYRHIKTKLDVFRMILDVSTMFIDLKFQDIADRKLDPETALRDWFDFAVDYLEEYPGIYRILFSDALYVEDRGLFLQFKAITMGLRDRFEKIIRKGMRGGDFRRDLDPKAWATLYLGVIHTSFPLWRVFNERSTRFRATAAALFENYMMGLVRPARESSR